jgi:hypothetical protein
VYRRALAELAGALQGRPFEQRDAQAQDAFLKRLEAGELMLGDIPSAVFFETLLANTIEGYFADPMYGGNRGMVGWRMVGFPGAYAQFVQWVDGTASASSGRRCRSGMAPPMGTGTAMASEARRHSSCVNTAPIALSVAVTEARQAVRSARSPEMVVNADIRYPLAQSLHEEKVDVVLVGMGWTGAIFAKELAEAGHSVVGLERGRMHDTVPDWQAPGMHDELRYGVRLGPDAGRVARDADLSQSRRTSGAADASARLVPAGHRCGRRRCALERADVPLPAERLRMRSHYDRALRPRLFDPELTVQDWGITYDELEPFYDFFEKVCGIGGVAGNLRGERRAGGNPFEGPRSDEYPNPPMKQSHGGRAFRKAAASPRLSSVPGAVGQHDPRLQQPVRRAVEAVHVLRLLRAIRLRALRQGEPAGVRAAVRDAQSELRAAHTQPGAAGAAV